MLGPDAISDHRQTLDGMDGHVCNTTDFFGSATINERIAYTLSRIRSTHDCPVERDTPRPSSAHSTLCLEYCATACSMLYNRT
jgi:hypothetical protein